MSSNSRIADFGIINYWWTDDYGAILTAFALQHFLSEQGYSSRLLKCWKYNDEVKRIGGISDVFRKKYMDVSEDVYSTYDDLFGIDNNKKINNSYLGFITGSDQVFRAEWVPDSWFLSFVKGRGKMAVAASFGLDSFKCNNCPRFDRIYQSIATFDYLSVREDDGVKICKEVFNQDAVQLIDPVFLINKEVYDNMILSINVEKREEYIFCYVRDKNESNSKMIKDLSTAYGLNVVWCEETMSIEEFLFSVRNCRYVITDSYHGLCFSLIFNKSYICIFNMLRGISRFNSLQRQLSLPKENFVEENSLLDIQYVPEVDYTSINCNICEAVNYSELCLKAALSDVYKKYN